MHEYFVAETNESIGFAWAQGKCNLTRMGHKHDPHVEGTRACPGHTAVPLYTLDRGSNVGRAVEDPFLDILDPLPDFDDDIRSAFA